MDELRAQASDPSTPGLDLQQLATNAELRPLIAKNPAAYTGLLDWLVNKNEPEVLAALRERQAAFDAGQMMPMPSLPLPLPGSSEPPPPSEPTNSEAPATDIPAETDASRPEVPVTPDSEATPATGETPSVSPNRTSIMGQKPDETTVLPPLNTPVSAPVQASGLPSFYPPNASLNQSAGMGNYGTVPPAAAQTQYMAPATGSTPIMSAAPTTSSTPMMSTAPTTSSTPIMSTAPTTSLPMAAKPKSNTGLWVIFSILLVAVIGMIVAIVLVMTGVIGGDDTQSDADSPNATGNTASEAPPAKDQDEDQNEDQDETPGSESPRPTIAPAPAGAQNIQSFVTETGDSTCRVNGDELICQVRNLINPVGGCDTYSESLVISLRDGDPSSTCQPNVDYNSSGSIIPHDSAMTYGDFACQSTYNGTGCWNTVTGKGFFFAKQDYHQQNVN